jgi:uncharacterized protein with HEPN domain
VSRDDDKRIADILEAAQEVAEVVAVGEDAFKAERLRQLAVERLLEIIGEAARAMTDDGRARYPVGPWSDVVGLRTLLTHHYHRVDPSQVWVIARDSVPTLANALRPGG